MSKITIYGIPNCDTMKKTFGWFNKNNIPFDFHNYKTDGITASTLKSWCKKAGWETVFNKKSSTWKKIAADHEGALTSGSAAIRIMQEYNSIIKRPVIESGDKLVVGYDENIFASL